MGQIGSAVYVAGSSKTAPRFLIFSIVLGAEYSFYVKSIATYAPQKSWHNNSLLGSVIRGCHTFATNTKVWLNFYSLDTNFAIHNAILLKLEFLLGNHKLNK